MTPAEMVNTLITVAKSAKFNTTQTYELIGRFTSAMLSEASGESSETLSPVTPDRLNAATPEPPKPRGNVVIKKDTVCVCAKCKKPQYKIVSDVYENMKVKEFIACFDPVLDAATELWSDPQGNVAIDCPSCKGLKTVWIKGLGNQTFEEYPEGDKYSNVQAT